jgi:hypothetical protein
MTLKRISITIPDSLVAAADERARALDRSRSWVLVEALRRYLEVPATFSGRAVHEVATGPYALGLGPYRQAQLEADLQLTSEQRVREAERTARVAELQTPGRRRDRVLTFDRYEDYLDWERWEDRRS